MSSSVSAVSKGIDNSCSVVFSYDVLDSNEENAGLILDNELKSYIFEVLVFY